MSQKLLIIGAGGHGLMAAEIAKKMDVWEEIKFLDDDMNITNPQILGKISEFYTYVNNYNIFVAIGNIETRERLLLELLNHGSKVPTLIHPTAIIGEGVEIGTGTILMPGTIINHSSKIGVGCIVNTGAIVEHNCKIGDFVHLSPGVKIAGTVNVGKKSWLGIGSVIVNNVDICEGSIIGAGAVVIKDIDQTGTYIGVPAKRVKIG